MNEYTDSEIMQMIGRAVSGTPPLCSLPDVHAGSSSIWHRQVFQQLVCNLTLTRPWADENGLAIINPNWKRSTEIYPTEPLFWNRASIPTSQRTLNRTWDDYRHRIRESMAQQLIPLPTPTTQLKVLCYWERRATDMAGAFGSDDPE